MIGVLHPGEMGAAVAAASHDEVVWAGSGRSRASRARADAAGLRDVADLAGVTGVADLILVVCPPDVALDVAHEVAATGFAGTYVDANAIAPSTAAAVAAIVTKAGARYVDGGIIGAPSRPRLLLSGEGATDVAARFGAPVTTVVLDHDGMAASAVKMTYAAWTKGTTALLLSIAAAAEQLGVGEALRTEWSTSATDLPGRLDGGAVSARKAWRWSGEMEEIARTLADAGLPDGFHLAAADVYTRLAALKDDTSATVADVLDLLLQPR